MGIKMKKNAMRVLALILAIVFLVPIGTIAGDEKSELKKLDNETKVLDRYITIDKNDNITFARQRAINDKVDDNIIELGDAIIKYCTGTTKDKKNNVTPLMSFPIHGKYCGPGHSGPGKPIDRLDAVCQKHDYCYHKKGYHKCPCDKAMLKSLKKLLPKLSGTTWLKCKVMIWWLGKKTSKVTKKGGAFSCRR